MNEGLNDSSKLTGLELNNLMHQRHNTFIALHNHIGILPNNFGTYPNDKIIKIVLEDIRDTAINALKLHGLFIDAMSDMRQMYSQNKG